MKVAIVGSREKHWNSVQKIEAINRIHQILRDYAVKLYKFEYGTLSDPGIIPYSLVTLVSGRCPEGGVDIWAESIAKDVCARTIIFPPEVHQWEDRLHYDHVAREYRTLKGYKSRNLQIARECDVLHCLQPSSRTWGGGVWTATQVKSLGKDAFIEFF